MKQSRFTQAWAEDKASSEQAWPWGGGGQQAAAELASLNSHSRFPWASDLQPRAALLTAPALHPGGQGGLEGQDQSWGEQAGNPQGHSGGGRSQMERGEGA